MRSTISIRIAKTSYIVISALYCLIGIFFICRPEISVSVIGEVAGIGMIVFGAIKLAGYFTKDLYRLAFQHDLALGLLMLAMGVLLLIVPERLMQSLCVIVGIAALADGLLKIQTSLDAKRFGLQSWVIILILAAAACVLGTMLVLKPAESAAAFPVLMGIAICAQGILNLLTGICTVKILRSKNGGATDIFDDRDR